jgi:hypothetical protein
MDPKPPASQQATLQIVPSHSVEENNGKPGTPQDAWAQEKQIPAPKEVVGMKKVFSNSPSQDTSSSAPVRNSLSPKHGLRQSLMNMTSKLKGRVSSWNGGGKVQVPAIAEESDELSKSHRISAIARNRGKNQNLMMTETSKDRVFGKEEHGSVGNRRVAALIHNLYFDTFITGMILVNSILIGLQIDYVAVHGRSRPLPDSYQVAEKLFCVLFTIELALRIVGDGKAFFASKKNLKFHLLDTTIVISAIIEQIMMLAGIDSSNQDAGVDPAVFSILRILRLVRVARSVRLMQFSRDLRALVHGMVYCLKPLFWAIVLLTLLMFMFSVVLMEFAIDEWVGAEDPSLQEKVLQEQSGYRPCVAEDLADGAARLLEDRVEGDTQSHAGQKYELRWYLGHLPRAMFTLFKAISGGQNWGEIAEPLKHVSWNLVAFFCLYIGVVVFAVLNIVTSIFIENARKNTLHDKDHLIWEEVQEHNWRQESLRTMFHKADLDGSGSVDFNNFKNHFEDPIVQAYFRTMGLDIGACGTDALFELLDFDRSGYIDEDTFVAGCTHFRGSAKQMDFEKLACHVKSLETALIAGGRMGSTHSSSSFKPLPEVKNESNDHDKPTASHFPINKDAARFTLFGQAKSNPS